MVDIRMMGNATFDITRVLEARKREVKGKVKEEYLVEWCPTWEPKENVSGDLPREKVLVVGIVDKPPKKLSNGLHNKDQNDHPLYSMEILIELTPFDGSPKKKSIMSYTEVRRRYPTELINFFENKAVLARPESMK